MPEPKSLVLLERQLAVVPPPFLGCARQRRLVETRPWSLARMNALLYVAGQLAVVYWREHHFDVFLSRVDPFTLLMVRGGSWQNWWVEDAHALIAVVNANSNLQVRGVEVIHELDSKLHARYVEAPTEAEARRITSMLESWHPDTRLVKNSPRAWVACNRCPVRRACDALDLEQGQTADWPGGKP